MCKLLCHKYRIVIVHGSALNVLLLHLNESN